VFDVISLINLAIALTLTLMEVFDVDVDGEHVMEYDCNGDEGVKHALLLTTITLTLTLT